VKASAAFMKIYGWVLMLAVGFNCNGESDLKPVRLASDISLQSSVKISMRVPPNFERKRLQIQLSDLTAEKPPEILFELSLRCTSDKMTLHLGYVNFFSAVGTLGREPTFTFDLPDLSRLPCPSADLYLTIEPQGVVAPRSFPHVKYVNILADGELTSARRG
jgi:hypothetical protein